MIRFVVIDTNVVVSGAIRGGETSPPKRIVGAMIGGHLRFLLSEDLLSEYRRVLLRPLIMRRHGLTEAEADELLLEIVLNATMREPAIPDASRDSTGGDAESASLALEATPAGDAHVAALLRSMPGCALVTGDQRLAETVTSWCEVITASEFAATLGI